MAVALLVDRLKPISFYVPLGCAYGSSAFCLKLILLIVRVALLLNRLKLIPFYSYDRQGAAGLSRSH